MFVAVAGRIEIEDSLTQFELLPQPRSFEPKNIFRRLSNFTSCHKKIRRRRGVSRVKNTARWRRRAVVVHRFGC